MQRYLLRTTTAVLCIAGLTVLPACGGHSKKPVGPDVRGLVLPDAEAALKKAKVGYTEHAKDAAFGIIVKSNFTVCSEAYVSAHLVRLEVAKDGC